jgi:putative FmdB family regulatory protein
VVPQFSRWNAGNAIDDARGVAALPLYEYKCNKCGHRFEKIEAITAPTTQRCPKCGAKSERQLAAPAIQFKGSGWYVTDYASKGANATSGEKPGDGKSAKTTEKPAPSKTGDSGKSESGAKKKKE